MGNGQDAFFDSVVEHLQEIAMNPQFQELRDGFLAKHAGVFEDTEENKLEYMGIFKEWVRSVLIWHAIVSTICLVPCIVAHA